MGRLLIGVFCILAPVAAWGELSPDNGPPPECLSGFGTLADDGVSIAVDTYRALFESLGGRKFASHLEHMIQAEDPFTVPDLAGVTTPPGTDIAAFRKSVSEFHLMLSQTPWDREKIRRAIVQELKVITDKPKLTVVDRTRVAVQPDRKLGFPPNASLAPSPDGRWVVGNHGSRHYVYHVATGETVTVPPDLRLTGPPVFSPHGTEVLYPLERGGLLRVPFHDGTLDFPGARTIEPTSRLKGHAAKLKTSADGDRVVSVPHSGTDGMSVYDLKTNQRRQVALPARMGPILDWGLIPGSDHIWILAGEGSRKLYRMEVHPDGTVENVQPPQTWYGQHNHVSVLNSGEVIGVDPYQLSRMGPGNVPLTFFPETGVKGEDELSIAGFTQDRGRNLGTALISVEDPETMRITWFDNATKKPVQNLPLKTIGWREIRYLGNSKSLLLMDEGGEWHLLDRPF